MNPFPLNPWTIALAVVAVLSAASVLVVLARIKSPGRWADVIAGSLLLLFAGLLFAGTRPRAAATVAVEAEAQKAALAEPAPGGTCLSLSPGNDAARAKAVLGKPDRVESAAHLRGPGAEIWRYDASQCGIHVFEGKIEFIE